jgi:Flp pilus assembly protein TadG
MRRGSLVTKFWKDTQGSVLVETTIVLPLFLLMVLGAVDASYMLYEWELANKAVYVGARTAVVSDPVDSGILATTATPQSSGIGQPCYTLSTPAPLCPTATSTCTSDGTAATCSLNAGSQPAFNTILTAMRQIFPRIAASNVTVTYATNGAGFMGDPSGLPMNVTVSLSCMTHQFYFVNGLMQWVFAPPCPGLTGPSQGPSLGSFATTMQSEDMATN